jgi:hypothetical protein
VEVGIGRWWRKVVVGIGRWWRKVVVGIGRWRRKVVVGIGRWRRKVMVNEMGQKMEVSNRQGRGSRKRGDDQGQERKITFIDSCQEAPDAKRVRVNDL